MEMSEKNYYDVYAYFWNERGKEPNWEKARKLNTYLTFRQKLCAFYLLNKKTGKDKLKNIVSNKEYKNHQNRSKVYLNPVDANQNSQSELSYLKNLYESLLRHDLNTMPSYSCQIQITFKLKKPYLSKDDDNFYIIDNPIVKDKVFKVPMVRSTTWKGALRFAAVKVFEEELNSSKAEKEEVFKKRAKIVKLFGNEKDSLEKYLGKICIHAKEEKSPTEKDLEEKVEEINKEFEEWLIENGYISKDIPSRAGRLFFYPTFFDRISLDVITPLDRKTRTPARGPIYFEVVPEGTGIFRVLYYPFDLIAKGKFGSIEEELEEDLKLLLKATMKMFTETGFSAKKTSGFGVAEIEEAKVVVKSGLEPYMDKDKTKETVACGLGISKEKVKVIPNERK